MGLSNEQRDERTDYIERNIIITREEDGKDYVFVSYKSDDWETVFKDAIYPLQREYGLRVYCDRDFETNNESWLKSMMDHIQSPHCRAVMMFFSHSYISSYATLLEVLTSQTNETADFSFNQNPKPLIPVYMENKTSFREYRETIVDNLRNTCRIEYVEWRAFEALKNEFSQAIKYYKAKKLPFEEDVFDSTRIFKVPDNEQVRIYDIYKSFETIEPVISANKNSMSSNNFIANIEKTIDSIMSDDEMITSTVFDETIKHTFNEDKKSELNKAYIDSEKKKIEESAERKENNRIESDHEMTDIYILYRYQGDDGVILQDYYIAKEIYELLDGHGINVFMWDEAKCIKKAEDKQLIDEKLDEASVLILVSSSPRNCEYSWVRYQWDSFYTDILNETKKGELIAYIDSEDISAFPRTIRNVPVFQKNKEGLSELQGYLSSLFGVDFLKNEGSNVPIKKGSSYNYENGYELGDERKRLAIQAKVESREDFSIISEFLPKIDKKYNVLDVGCSMGAVTFEVFGRYEDRVFVLGVDKFKKCVDGFNEEAPSNMVAEQLNFDNEGWEEILNEYMRKYDLNGFDMVYCSLSLHHMFDSKTFVRKIRKYINEDGYIYIRTCDDALKLAYPEGEVIYDIINRTAEVPGASDRFHGRKVFSILEKAKFKDIQFRTFLIDTVGKTKNERYALFYSAFVWRKNYFKNRLDNATEEKEITEAMEEYSSIMEILDRIENLFMNELFYFGYYVTIAIGKKNDVLDILGG